MNEDTTCPVCKNNTLKKTEFVFNGILREKMKCKNKDCTYYAEYETG